MRHTLRIKDWHPKKLNELLGNHHKAGRLKKADRQIVALERIVQNVPQATGKRRVTLTIVLGPRQRGGDPDAYFKSLLDALVQCGLLLDDRRQCVELAPVQYERGPIRETVIDLEDVAACN